MSYYFNKVLNVTFDDAVTRVVEELKKEGFGILTEIDVRQTFKKKLNVDFRNYRILGACNPSFAYKALQAEEKIGTMLPCNVIVLVYAIAFAVNFVWEMLQMPMYEGMRFDCLRSCLI